MAHVPVSIALSVQNAELFTLTYGAIVTQVSRSSCEGDPRCGMPHVQPALPVLHRRVPSNVTNLILGLLLSSQLIRDYEDPREVNLQLEQMLVAIVTSAQTGQHAQTHRCILTDPIAPSLGRYAWKCCRGYNIGIRLVDEFCAKNRGARCRTFKEAMEAVAKVRAVTGTSNAGLLMLEVGQVSVALVNHLCVGCPHWSLAGRLQDVSRRNGSGR